MFILDQAVAVPEAVLANLAVELVVAVRNVGVAEGVEPVEVGVVAKRNPQAHPQHKRYYFFLVNFDRKIHTIDRVVIT